MPGADLRTGPVAAWPTLRSTCLALAALALAALAVEAPLPARAEPEAPAVTEAAAPVDASGLSELERELLALGRRQSLSRHAAGILEQAEGVRARLREARRDQASASTVARLQRLLHALVRAAEAADARDRERALYASAARRLADVEAQLGAARGAQGSAAPHTQSAPAAKDAAP